MVGVGSLSADASASSQVRKRAYILSGGIAGVLEIFIFHPIDTTAKRLIVNKGLPAASAEASLKSLRPPSASSSACGSAVVAALRVPMETLRASWRIALGSVSPTAPLGQQVHALYFGLSFALVYKTLQRSFQYSVQPSVAKYLGTKHRPFFAGCFGRFCREMEHGVAGCVMGCGEVVFLPIDSLKVKCQTNRPLGFQASASEGLFATLAGSYRGATWMAMRNSVGSFALFGGAALTKEHVLKLEDFERATALQHFLASTAASVFCVWISAPFDVLKTRVQRQGGGPGAKVRTGAEIARQTLKEEGWRAFFKGVVPKCVVVAPKLMFTYTVANLLYSRMVDHLEERVRHRCE
eukprot:gnl/TRDRNA2_/TRDRNA2_204598_c0_seq1.p1 gnl/TRDRNA2_/TRDRNA2_204598_c0~~gnl/TRDRNA2_/TRDRNA2_204598_c0_seq1.p1  ORF type:complete len:364 (-),score=50.41 gnl/TRDRNA2_/TRDRNA2_204598_c0_seq1:136-1191(-)